MSRVRSWKYAIYRKWLVRRTMRVLPNAVNLSGT